MVRAGLCVVAAALVLSGCVARTGGTPEPAPGGDEPVGLPTPPRPGDQIDPCSLIEPAAFEPAGTVHLPGTPDIVECRVSVTTDAGPAVVRLGGQAWPDELSTDRELVADLGRGATVEWYGPDCEMVLVLADDAGSKVGIMATATGSSASEELLCELAERAATGVFTVLTAGQARFWTPEPNSLALLDACELLPEESMYRHLDAREKTSRTPTACFWNGQDGWAILWFPVGAAPIDFGVRDATSETIGGRDSFAEDKPTCRVLTRHIEFEPDAGRFEFAMLMVGANDPCAVARALAAEAWPKLPT